MRAFVLRRHRLIRESGAAVGAIAARIDDTLGRGEPDLRPNTRRFFGKRFGKLQAQEKSFLRAGVELAQGMDFSATCT